MKIEIDDFVMDIRRHNPVYPCYPIIRKTIGVVKKIHRSFVTVKWAKGPLAGIPARYLEIVDKKGKKKQ